MVRAQLRKSVGRESGGISRRGETARRGAWRGPQLARLPHRSHTENGEARCATCACSVCCAYSRLEPSNVEDFSPFSLAPGSHTTTPHSHQERISTNHYQDRPVTKGENGQRSRLARRARVLCTVTLTGESKHPHETLLVLRKHTSAGHGRVCSPRPHTSAHTGSGAARSLIVRTAQPQAGLGRAGRAARP